jgi:uncharacterized membrane protein
MSDPQTAPGASPGTRAGRPAWLLPVIMSVATSLIAIVLMASRGLYWMIAVIAVAEALGIFTIVRTARINARRTP